jgi:hypothetical protein
LVEKATYRPEVPTFALTLYQRNLQISDMILFQEGASRINDKGLACGGTLTLSSSGLSFEGLIAGDENCARSLSLDDINEVVWFKTLNIIPNGFSLMLKGGSVESFIVTDKKRWKELIDHAKSGQPVVAI